MEPTNQQLLRKPDVQPTNDAIAQALGEANDAYLVFSRMLADIGIQLQWRYYTDGKAWLAKGLHKRTGVHGGQKDVTIFWLSICDGFFKVTLYFPEKARADVMNLPIDHEIKQMIADSEPMGSKLKFFPLVLELRSDEMFEAVYTLADFKKG